MIPQNLSFGGGPADTIVNPMVLVVALIAGVLVCVLPRRTVIVPFLLVGILIPLNQVIVVAGLHFPIMRVLALFGFVRMAWVKISSSEKILSGGMNGIDWAMIVLAVVTFIDGLLLWQSQAEAIFQLGNLYTATGIYFLMRYLIRDEEDVQRTFRILASLSVIIATFMIFEYFTRDNLFYRILGGVNAATFSTSAERAGGVRAQGCFAHPILAGSFAGFVAPLLVAWWSKEKKERKLAGLGILAAAIIPFTTGSSTPLFALLGAIGALCLWPLRRRMRLIRWGIVGTLAAGQLYMTSPVWHIISDVRLSDASSSYHRYMLVDQCIRHFWNWALVGTKDYASWGFDMWDLSNQYVFTADTAGLIPFIALICILVFAFKYIGKARKLAESDSSQEFFIWAVGASLFANVVAFFGISYFDQTIVGWYAVLAIISAVTVPLQRGAKAQQFEPQFVFRPALAGTMATSHSDLDKRWLGKPPALGLRTPTTDLRTRSR